MTATVSGEVRELASRASRNIEIAQRVEWRDLGQGDATETTIRGHAAVFDSLSEDLGGFREKLAPGAFRSVLRTKPDVRLLHNHDPNYVLARTASGSLELREDGTGLHVWARVDTAISWIADLRRSMLRGDVDQMSFSFLLAEGGDHWDLTDAGPIRTILPDGISDLFDASVVAYPAYPATAASIRSAGRRQRLDERRRALRGGLGA